MTPPTGLTPFLAGLVKSKPEQRAWCLQHPERVAAKHDIPAAWVRFYVEAMG